MKTTQTYKIGDCLELMKEIPSKSIDMVLTDIPYGVVNRDSNGLRNLNKGNVDIVGFKINILCNELNRICNGNIYIFCGTEQISEIRGMFVKFGLSTRLGIWNKTNPSPMNGEYIWLSGLECCVFAKNKKSTFKEFCKKPIWDYPSENYQQHPTQKPVELFKYLINVSTNESDTVLDPFLGSGTTLRACRETNRNGIGFEINPDYEPIIRKRLMADTPPLESYLTIM